MDVPEGAVGEEVGAAQARVRVRASLHQWQAAVPVRERLFGARDSLLHPRRFPERPVDGQRDPLPADIDTVVKAVHLALDGVVVEVRVAGGHPDRAVLEHPLDHRQRHAVIDQAGAEVVTEPVRMNPARQPPAAVTDLRESARSA